MASAHRLIVLSGQVIFSLALAASEVGLQLRLPLDGEPRATVAVAPAYVTVDDARWGDGRRGGALVGGTLSLAAPANWDPRRGTLSCWLARPSAAERSGAVVAVRGFAVRIEWERGRLFFMSGATDAQGFAWDYQLMDRAPTTWSAGQWHHLAVAWEAGVGRRWWLDGRSLGNGGAGRVSADPFTGSERLVLDASVAGIDELTVWDRVLADREVAQLAEGTGPAIAATADAVAAMPRALPVDRRAGGGPPAIIAPGERFSLPIAIDAGCAWRGRIAIEVEDWRGHLIERRERDLDCPDPGRRELIEEMVAPARGVFRVGVRIPAAGGALRDVVSVACWPQPGPVHPFFGHHVATFSDQTVRLAERLGIRHTRAHNMLQSTWWPRVQPEPGRPAWRADDQMARAAAAGMTVLGQVFGTPYWAAAGGPLAPPTRPDAYPSGARPDSSAFRAHLVDLAARDWPAVDAWEVWNEPDVSMFWGGSPEELAALVGEAASTLKTARPALPVMAPGITQSGLRWLRAFAVAGGLDRLDAISYHAYHRVEDPDLIARRAAETCRELRAVSRERLGRELPLWDSESGSSDQPQMRGIERAGILPASLSEERQGERAAWATVQHAGLLLELGVVRSYAYLWHLHGDGRYEPLSWLEPDQSPKAKAVARQAMSELLAGATFHRSVRWPQGRGTALVFDAGGGSSVVLWWTGWDACLRLPVAWPGAVRAVDLMGEVQAGDPGRLTDEPSYCLVAASPAAVATALEAAVPVIDREPRPLPIEAVAAGHGVGIQADFPAALEKPEGLDPLDISAVANMGFADERAGDGVGGWADEGPFNCLHEPPMGLHRWFGVPFRILDPATNGGRAVVTLRGSVTPRHPSSITLPLGDRPLRALYLLTAVSWAPPAGRPAAELTIRYVDGGQDRVPLRTGIETGNWWLPPGPDEVCRTVPLHENGTADGKPGWRYWRAWEWQASRWDRPVADAIIADAGAGTTILIAATVLR